MLAILPDRLAAWRTTSSQRRPAACSPWAATWRSPASGTARCGSPAGASGVSPRTGRARSGCCAGPVELGVDFIDTADSYGPFVSEELIREALHPYDGLTIATKGGLIRTGPGPVGHRRPARVPAAVRGDEPAPPRPGHDRPVPAAPDRSADPGRRPGGRAGRPAQGGQDPAHRAVRGERAGDRRGPADRPDRVGAEPLQRAATAGPRTCWTTASGRGSASSRTARSRPASSRRRPARWRCWPGRRA